MTRVTAGTAVWRPASQRVGQYRADGRLDGSPAIADAALDGRAFWLFVDTVRDY